MMHPVGNTLTCLTVAALVPSMAGTVVGVDLVHTGSLVLTGIAVTLIDLNIAGIALISGQAGATVQGFGNTAGSVLTWASTAGIGWKI